MIFDLSAGLRFGFGVTNGSVVEFVLSIEVTGDCVLVVLRNPPGVLPLPAVVGVVTDADLVAVVGIAVGADVVAVADGVTIVAVAVGIVVFRGLNEAVGLETGGWELDMLVLDDDDDALFLKAWGRVWEET